MGAFVKDLAGEAMAPRDFELGLDRVKPVSYLAALPAQEPAQGLVFVIPGFGADASDVYLAKLRRRIADEHGFVAVSVKYHCINARPDLGAKVDIGVRARLTLLGLAVAGGQQPASLDDVAELCRRAGLVKPGFEVEADILPPDGETQNFGVLQAMDHLAVLGALRARGVRFDERRIAAIGSSHGGYIAHLIAKIAPSTLAAVIDNSSYVQAPYAYLGLGVGQEMVWEVGGVRLVCRVKSPWTLASRSAAGFFDRNRELIRDAGFPPHIAAMALQGGRVGPRFFMHTSAHDTLARPEDKRRQQQALTAAGLDATLEIVTPEMIDGALFKTLDHGMNASLRRLFARHAPAIEPRETVLDADRGTVVRYDCLDAAYEFVHSAQAPYIQGRTAPLFSLRERAQTAA